MGFLDILRTPSTKPATGRPGFATWPNTGNNAWSDSGKRINSETALTSATVYACIRVLTTNIASLALPLYKRNSDNTRSLATYHHLYKLFQKGPNEFQTMFQWLNMMSSHVFLTGNAYSLIERDANMRVTSLYPLNPLAMQMWTAPNGELWYEYRPQQGQPVWFQWDQINHWIFQTIDGVTGMNPIAYGRNSIGTDIRNREHQAKQLANNATPAGVLTYDNTLSEQAFKAVRESWERIHKGSENAGKIAILDRGIKFEAIGVTNEDLQWIESMKYGAVDVCKFFGVPLHMVSELDRSTFSNIEHQQLEFVMHTLVSILRAFEQCLNRDLLLFTDRDRLYFEFHVDSLLRGDLKSRYDAYAVGRQWGWLSSDEIRLKENMEPLPREQGNMFLRPLNMVPADTPVQIKSQDQGSKPGDTPPPVNDPQAAPPADPTADNQRSVSLERVEASLKLDFIEAFGRISSRESKKFEQLSKNLPVDRQVLELEKRLTDFYKEQRGQFKEMLEPAVRSAFVLFCELSPAMEMRISDVSEALGEAFIDESLSCVTGAIPNGLDATAEALGDRSRLGGNADRAIQLVMTKSRAAA
jgi:HK97 family phage portal protein